MEYIVDSTTQNIEFAPAIESAEILQNIRTILNTPKFSVPLAREFGLSLTALDNPVPAAQAKLTAEISDAVRRWEPRARVTFVSFQADSEGLLRPVVRVRIVEPSTTD